MKSLFCGFYSTSNDSLKNIWLSESTLFVFDTNCLLNLYRCEDHTRTEIIDVMRELKEKTWLPFQVGFEYQRNRRLVIEDSISSLNKIQEELKKIYTQNILSSGSVKKHLYNALSEEVSTLQQELQKSIDLYIKEKIEPRIISKRKIAEHDFIRDDIDNIIGKNTGEIPTQERINSINEEGQKRYINKRPPGFKDEQKKDISFFANIEFQDKFGDLYLWKEIIHKAKDEKIKNVIFVCDDNKNDWWFVHAGKTHGPLEALKTEICTEAKINEFRLINQLTFLHEAKQFLTNINISDSSLKEVEELSHDTEIIQEPMGITLEEIFKLYRKGLNAVQNKKPSTDYENAAVDGYMVKISNIKKTIGKAEDLIDRGKDVIDKIQNLNIDKSIINYDEVVNHKIKIMSNSSRLTNMITMMNDLLSQGELLEQNKFNEALQISRRCIMIISDVDFSIRYLENIINLFS